MKLVLLLGGIIGFGIGMLFGIAQSSGWPDVIWKSCVATYVGALLMKWWGKVWIRCLYESMQEKKKNSKQETPVTQEATAKSSV